LKSQNLTADQVIQRYVNAELFLQRDPMNGILWLMDRYKVDPQQLLEAAKEITEGKRPKPGSQPSKPQQQQQPQLDPNDPAHAAILELQNKEKERERQTRLRMQHEVDTSTKAFEEEVDKDGNKLYPYATVPEVKKMMGVLFASGEVNIAKAGGIGPALKIAYDKAVYTHAPTREAVLKAQSDAEAKKKAEEEKRKVEKARTVGQSMSGASSPGSAPQPKKGQSVRDSLRQTAQQIGFNN
jgi:hypothetical protein